MKAKIKYLALIMMPAILLLGTSGGSAGFNDPVENRIFEMAAAEMGFVPDDVQPGDVNRIEFPLSGATLYQVKFADNQTNKTYGIVMDESGAVRNLEEARRAEQAAHDARLSQLMAEDSDLSADAAIAILSEAPHGHLSNRLFDQLDNLDAAGTLTVAIWLRADDVSSLERPDLGHQPATVEAGDAPYEPMLPNPMKKLEQSQQEENLGSKAPADRVEAIRATQDELRFIIEDARQKNMAHLKSQMVFLQAPLVADLNAMGFEPEYVSPLAPLVYVELSKSEILALVRKGYVDTIYGPNVNRDMMNTAKATQKADIVDNWFGFDGTGIDVAITEDSRIDWPHTYLNTGTTRVPGHSNVDFHATATAGMVASQHGTYQGIAQGVNMFSANGTSYSDANMSAAMDWAATTQNVDVMNNSWGASDLSSLNEHDRHLDYLVRNSACTATVAAGNDGATSGHNIGSPGKAYNVITVGVYDDRGTLTWDDDAIHSGSSYNDPSTGCDKPEVAASGTNITSTLMGNAIGNAGWGTSYAAPMVAGAAALLMDRSSTLESWPEAVKAIIMATALHNIEGASRLSDKDGAGGIDMRAALRVADEGWWTGRSIVQGDLPLQYSVYAYAGQIIRAAIAWDSNPNASYTTDPLEADIDLRLRNPSGTIVASSSSGSNSSEIVEYTAPTTGTYTIEAYVFSWSGTSNTYLGVAWWPGHRILGTPIQTMGTPPISRDYFQFSPNFGYWNVVGIRSPSGGNYNIYMYDGSAFGDPDDYDLLEDSTLSAAIVDYVVIDRNHAPFGTYNTEVRAVSGSGTYPIQWWNPAAAASDGTYPLTITPVFVLKAFDVNLSAGTTKYFAIKTVSGNADLGMALHDSTVGTPPTYYQGRSNRVVQSDVAGAGGEESMTYLASASDDMGLIVWNNGSTVTTTFNLYVDSTAATGSIVINGGAGYTGSTNVTLTLSATDSQTGVAEMRVGNTGGPWSAWESYASTKSWTLPSGDGTKTVWVQFRNNAGMISNQYSDSIIIDTAAPTPNPMTWATEPFETSTSAISMVAVTASDPNTPINYYFDFYSSPTGGTGGTDSGWQSSTTYTDSGLGTNHRYGYRVYARDASLNMASPSAVSNDYTDIETPTGVTFGSYGSTYIYARTTNTPSGLTRGSSGLIIYNVTRGNNSGWKQNNNYWFSSSLTPNTSYAFRAQAKNGDADMTTYSNYYYRRTLAAIPGANSFTNITQTSIRANWTPNGNPAGTQYFCENTTAGTNSGWTTSTSWNSTGLSPDTSSTFQVKAKNEEGFQTGWTNLGSATTLPPSVPPCEGDFEPKDGEVDDTDLAILAADFGRTNCSSGPPCEGDFGGDGDVDGTDLAVFAADFGRTDCP